MILKKDEFDGLFAIRGPFGCFGEGWKTFCQSTNGIQAVMCQHCNHGACENCCPVGLQTYTDVEEGQNQMAITM